MVGIRRLHSKLRLAPVAPLTRIHPRKTKSRHPLPGAERRLALAEDREVARSCTDDLTFRSQRQRLSFLRRGVTPRPASLESNYFQKLMGPGRPFRLAKLTACRKVRGMYRRCRPKSSHMGIKARWRKRFRLSLVMARSVGDEAIQCRRRRLDCFASLAMTTSASRDRP